VIAEKNRVFVTTAYPKGKPIGGLMLEFDPQWKAKEVWRSAKIACHWMTPLYREGHLYAIDGETERLARLVCFDAETGKEVWEHEITWQMPIKGQNYNFSILRASLLDVDDSTLCLGETGSLHWLDLSPKGCKELERTQLWIAPNTWALPVISRGLLYVGQHDRDQVDGTEQRFLCYDLRAP
jgi:outer membrane protein assembly factor BamB